METHIGFGLSILATVIACVCVVELLLRRYAAPTVLVRRVPSPAAPIVAAPIAAAPPAVAPALPDRHCVFCWDAVTHEHATSGAGTCALHAREGVAIE